MNLSTKITILLQLLITTAIAQPTATFTSLEPKFGSGYDGSIVVQANTILNIDPVRAKVTNISVGSLYLGSNWPYEYIVTHNSAHGQWTSVDVDNVVLLHQSYQPNCQGSLDYLTSFSAHIFAWVSNVNASGNVITIRTNVPLTSTLIPTTISANDQVQILRINNWNNLEFEPNSGFTVSAWDGETGGIMAFLVAGTLTFAGDNITFDVSEKGYAKGTRDNNVSNNVTVVTSAPGTSLDLNASGGEGTFFNNKPELRMTLIGDCSNPEIAPDGGYGTFMEMPTAATPHVSTAQKGCLANIPTYFNIGSGGSEGKPGKYGAAAGGSGGHGGPNENGSNGSAGGIGGGAQAGSSGYGGAGGKGGGVIFIYAYEYNYNSAITTNVIFKANGGDAEHGDDGLGIGGTGGSGGNGADGVCNGPNDYAMPGNKGYKGQAGKGADGGGGGSGGYPGYIRFFSNSYVDQQLTGSVAEAKPGNRGFGGEGQAKGASGTNGNAGAKNLSSPNCVECYPTIENETEECNCAMALATIAEAGNVGGTLTNTGNYIYSTVLNADFDNDDFDWKMSAYWDPNNQFLRVWRTDIEVEGETAIPGPEVAQVKTTKIYNCVLEELDNGTPTGDRYDVFSALQLYLSGSANWAENINANGVSTFSQFNFKNENQTPPQEGFWRNSSNTNIAQAVGCDAISNGGGGTPEESDGNDGEGGKGREPDEELPGGKRNGSDYTTDFNTENVMFVNGVSPEPPLGVNNEPIEFKVFPNPANHRLSIELGLLKDKELQELRVFSVKGKEVNSFNYVVSNGFIELEDLQNLEKGTYIVQLTIENKAYAISFVKE